MIRFLCRCLAIAVISVSVHTPLLSAELNVLQQGNIDSNALNFSDASASFSQNVNGRTYQRHPMATLNGWQYVTYYDSNRNVCLARRQLPTGSWEIIRFTDYTINGNDSHNVVTLGICALDGTIHLAFDHHGGDLNYRISNQGVATDPGSVTWSTSLFGSVIDNLGSVGKRSNVTYPSFFNASNGNLMLYYRRGGSGNGDGMIYEYDGTTHDWTTGMGEFIASTGTYNGDISTNSTSRNPYINGISYGGDRLHASWGWRESAGGSNNNHDLMYAYSDDDGRTWLNSAGTQIGTTNSSFITLDSTGVTVAAIPQNIGLSNQYTHYAYDDGSCHVIVAHIESGTSNKRYHHYWRDVAGNWSDEALPFSASRPKLVGDDDRSLFLAYASGGKPNIAKGVPNVAMTSWTWTNIHTQSDTTEGGEGHIDTSRWEVDRILSFYGQENTNTAGDSTPLHIYDYQVSAKAILPVPLHAANEINESTTLQWTAGINASTHRVYLGTDPVAVAAATTASPEYQGSQTSTTFTPVPALTQGTDYYWRIDEVDTGSNVHAGLLWSFSTAGNLPPTITGLADRTEPMGSPVPDVDFMIDDDLTDPDSLILTVSSSNTSLLPNSNLTFTGTGTNRSLQISPVAGQTGSSLVTVGVNDGTHLVEDTLTVTITAPAFVLLSEANDASIRENPDVVDIDKSTTLLGTGGSSPRVDRCTVYVFQLPDLGAESNPFANAAFNFEFTAKQGTLRDNDLYGLGRRTLPEVLASDYYGKTAVVDSGATLLQTDILTNSTSFGVLGTSAAGETSLRDYLNAQYDSGAGAGDYVFLRLNTAGYADGIHRATLTMSEGAVETPVDTRPRINLTTTAFSGIQNWRFQHFGTPSNSGDGADDADPDSDGEKNDYEFATGQDPHANTRAPTTLADADGDLEFSYDRNTDAVADGYVFAVEWSDTLLSESWSTSGVSQSVDSQNGNVQSMIATVPTDNAPTRFVRLRITTP